MNDYLEELLELREGMEDVECLDADGGDADCYEFIDECETL